MRWLNDRPIAVKLSGLVLVPLLLLGVVLAAVGVERFRSAGEAEAMHGAIRLAVTDAAVIHEVQRERGVSARAAAAGGFDAGIPAAVADQRTATDQVLAAALTGIDPGTETDVGQVIGAASGVLASIRKQAESGSDSAALIDGYTALISRLLDALDTATVAGQDAELARGAAGYLALLRAKEIAGVERALLSAVFASDSFAPGQYQQAATLIGQRSALLDQARAGLGVQVSALLSDVIDGPQVGLAELEAIALASPGGGFGVDADSWFARATEVIDAYGSVDAAQAELLLSDSADIRADAVRSIWVGGLALAGIVAAVLVIGWALIRRITGPLRATVHVLERVAVGDLRARAEVTSADEVGRIGAAVNSAVESMGAAVDKIAASAHVLAAATEELTSISHEVAANAAYESDRADAVADGAVRVSGTIRTVADGADQLEASIREIAQSTTDVTGKTDRAVGLVSASNDSVQRLAASSTEIGAVVQLIATIADQTNLLALNASIEAARAGESGKGFAVVANEIKDLAQETARATEDVGRRIAAIQTDTSGAVDAITQIDEVIGEINSLQLVVASAVEQQSATTAEMSSHLRDAAEGSVGIADGVRDIAGSAEATTGGVRQTQQAAGELSRMFNDLKSVVDTFEI